ncbi:MAG: hypothetical protein ACON49_00010 [Candidatus Puniceispirillaceae bacterium]
MSARLAPTKEADIVKFPVLDRQNKKASLFRDAFDLFDKLASTFLENQEHETRRALI